MSNHKLDPSKVKAASEAAILAVGGRVLDTLPVIGLDELRLRASEDVARRAVVLSTLVYMSFGAPPPLAFEWIKAHGLLQEVSPSEQRFLEMTGALDDDQRGILRWNIEALWAAAWAGSLVPDLGPVQPIADTLVSLVPDMRTGESPQKFLATWSLRPLDAIYGKLDHFYRAHWYARDCDLTGQDATPFHPGIVQTRRQMLEWIVHADQEWDHVDLST